MASGECKRCGIDFQKNSNSQKYCKVCSIIRSKEMQKTRSKRYVENNKKLHYKRNKEWCLNNKEKTKESKRKYIEKNKDMILIKNRIWAENNRNYYKNYHKQYLQTENGKIKSRERARRRRANLNNIIEIYTREEWNNMLDMTNGCCPKCGKFVGKTNLELDHIIPISKASSGSTYTINDIQPLCRKCNASKGDKI